MYKIDKNRIYSVLDVFKRNVNFFGPGSSLKGYFVNDLDLLNGTSDDFIANHYELAQVTDLCDFAFKAQNGKWFKYFVPEDAVEHVEEPSSVSNSSMSKDFVTLRDFLGLFDSSMKSKRRVEVFVWDDKEYDGLISDIPEDFKHLDDEVVSFSTYIDDGFYEYGERDYDERTLTLEPVLSVFVEN